MDCSKLVIINYYRKYKIIRFAHKVSSLTCWYTVYYLPIGILTGTPFIITVAVSFATPFWVLSWLTNCCRACIALALDVTWLSDELGLTAGTATWGKMGCCGFGASGPQRPERLHAASVFSLSTPFRFILTTDWTFASNKNNCSRLCQKIFLIIKTGIWKIITS